MEASKDLTWFDILCLFQVTLKSLLLQEMIDEADRDGDGEVSQDEFLRIMKKTSLY